MPARIAITSSAPGNGKTTVGRVVAARLGLPFVEADALAWENGVEISADVLRSRLAAIVESEAWVIDGVYRGKVGNLVLGAADTVVWLDLPIRSWLPRLVRRSFTQRDSPHGIATGVLSALRGHRSRRRRYPKLFEGMTVVRLRSDAEVESWLMELE